MRDRWVRELWRSRELLAFLAWRDVKIRYKQTVLGASWAVIQPFATMLIFSFFFGRLMKVPSDGAPYPIFAYSALLPWTYFSTSVTLAGNSLVGNANLIRKVYFPRAVIPLASAVSGLLDLAIASVVLLGLMMYFDISPDIGLLMWPLLTGLLVLLVVGSGMILASLNVRYRDVKYAMPFVIQALLFLTPVIYPTSILPDRFRVVAALNPLTGLIEAMRAAALPGLEIDWRMLGISTAVIILILVAGVFYFRNTEREFADII